MKTPRSPSQGDIAETPFDIGCDLVDVARLAGIMARQKKFLLKHFTESERDYFATFSRPEPHIAGHFAAKEAVSKALGQGMRDPLSFDGIAIAHDERGKPQVQLLGEVKKKWGHIALKITISHTDSHALAVALAIDSKSGA